VSAGEGASRSRDAPIELRPLPARFDEFAARDGDPDQEYQLDRLGQRLVSKKNLRHREEQENQERSSKPAHTRCRCNRFSGRDVGNPAQTAVPTRPAT
jgi:hypothetical protein